MYILMKKEFYLSRHQFFVPIRWESVSSADLGITSQFCLNTSIISSIEGEQRNINLAI
jgi:hypothetical protein